MQDMYLSAELLPDIRGIMPTERDVIWFVCFLVSRLDSPAMLVRIAHQLAIRVPMGRKAQTESNDSPGTAVYQDVRERFSCRVPCAACGERPCRVRSHLNSKLKRGGVVVIGIPRNVAKDVLARVGQNLLKF